MPDKTFWCDYEMERFPIAELGKDELGAPIHVSDGPCHHPNGNLCREEPPVRVLTVTREEQEQLWKQLEEPR
ncbi:MAG TPA: hypothetical protein VMU89_07575 [Thermomicrobiaceae bacterium]|nr:hypothetical protein [Thermomicrobiaceae bacterium]